MTLSGLLPGRGIVPAAAAAALVVVAAATASSGSAVPVTLRLVGAADRNTGQSVRLSATARLPAGAHLLIQRFSSGKAPAKVVECLRSPCTGSYRDAIAEEVTFQAFAIKRTGAKATILGKSNRVTVTWSEPSPTPTEPTSPPSPPAPPSPAATPGHYEGKTADHELFRFDVTADGRSLTHLQTGQMNEHCEPSGSLSGGDLSGDGPFPIALDGSFTISGSFSSSIDGQPGTNTILITGHISGGTASGTYREDTSFPGYSCTTGDQTWAAAKT